jgi:pyruvate/2-oxoacid:ferredoxin oxidoreductase beta subunit/Pyruvate/2-oxoacid:ferredoxin oxidoreductase gamma subunit
MSTPVQITPLASYRNATPYPFCPGCGHGSILDRLNDALVGLQRDPRDVVIVSDIGCSGLSDQYFDTQALHGLHGRSLTYATGLKLARPSLTAIVIMGDGGTGIGGAHLLAAARRNLDLTTLVFNNLNYGMTGGQHSGTTPTGAITATTPAGHLERPLDVCATAAAAGATYVCRSTSFDEDLADRITEAIEHPGFALLDIWEPCTAYYAPRNRLNKKATFELIERLGFTRGVVCRTAAPEFGAAYRAAAASALPGHATLAAPIEPRQAPRLDRPFRLVLAGAAGGRVGTAARLLCKAGIVAGLYAAERRDYPVTVKTGYSLAEVVLSPRPIDDVNVAEADALVFLAPEGRAQALSYLSRLSTRARVFAVSDAGPEGTGHRVERLDLALAGVRVPRELTTITVVAAVAFTLGLVSPDAFREAIEPDEAPRITPALAGAERMAAALARSAEPPESPR